MARTFVIDTEMQELVGLLSKAIKPRKERGGAVWRENPHAPYYSRHRFKRII